MISKRDKKIISLVSRDIPLTKKPFKDLADNLGMDERILLRRIKSLKKSGLMRKFSAALNHRKIGFLYNAMVVWNVPDRFVEEAGKIMSSFAEVSHCYQRKRAPDWDYNLYSMVHGRTRKDCLAVVEKISGRIGPDIGCKISFSSKEEKKVGAIY